MILLFYSRKGPLSYRTPDFSKVEPRVRFPKSGYKPPKSKMSSKKEFLSPGPPIVFKSPADIVKEVLLDATDGPPTPSACNRPTTSAPSATVPQDFRCRQQATTLLEQLQVLLETEPWNKPSIYAHSQRQQYTNCPTSHPPCFYSNAEVNQEIIHRGGKSEIKFKSLFYTVYVI